MDLIGVPQTWAVKICWGSPQPKLVIWMGLIGIPQHLGGRDVLGIPTTVSW